jgi:AcrR family transcriptional regulator
VRDKLNLRLLFYKPADVDIIVLSKVLHMPEVTKKSEQNLPSAERILQCALDLFVKNGYRATTVDNIAADVGMTKGAVYFHFESKTTIMLRLLDEAEAIVVSPVIKRIEGLDVSAIQKLIVFLNQVSMIALQHSQHRLLLILASIEFCGSSTEINARARSIYRRLYTCVERFLHEGQTQGTVRTDIHSHELTSVVMAYFDGTLIDWRRRPGELDGKSLTSAARSTLLDGIRAKPQPPARVVHNRAGERPATDPQY